jgi:hypothetical protein
MLPDQACDDKKTLSIFPIIFVIGFAVLQWNFNRQHGCGTPQTKVQAVAVAATATMMIMRFI